MVCTPAVLSGSSGLAVIISVTGLMFSWPAALTTYEGLLILSRLLASKETVAPCAGGMFSSEALDLLPSMGLSVLAGAGGLFWL